MAGDTTAIEWTHRPGTKGATWNPIVAYRWVDDPKTGERKRLRGWYCEHATTGCINCYSEKQNLAGARGGTKLPFKPGHRDDVEIEMHEPTLLQPLHWKSPRTIFVCSMTDLYGEWVKDEWLDKIKAVQALTPQHTYIELTKRAERMREYCAAMPVNLSTEVLTMARPDKNGYPIAGPCVWPLPNVWLGVSCERQQEADERIPHLLQTPAAIRFVSAEPLLEEIRFKWGRDDHVPNQIDWMIVGGESGSKARPFCVEWADSIVDQCRPARVACFVKQFGSAPKSDGYALHLKDRKGGNWDEWPGRLRIRQFPVIEGRESQPGLSSPDSKQTEDASA